MKKITRIGMIVILFLTAVFAVSQSGSAQAGNGSADVSVTVKNLTGGTVTLRLTGENTTYWFTFEGQGMYSVSVPEGRYSYYASTLCGGESGEFNLNVHKLLNFYCDDGPEVSLTKPEVGATCNLYGWWHTYSGSKGHWHSIDEPGTPFHTDISTWEMRCTDGDPSYGDPT